MSIDINHLSEEELMKLNHRIVEKLRLLRQIRSQAAMMNFYKGAKVSFEPEGRAPHFATVTRLNKKTVSVITDSGEEWNVHPSLLRHVKDLNDNKSNINKKENILELFKTK